MSEFTSPEMDEMNAIGSRLVDVVNGHTAHVAVSALACVIVDATFQHLDTREAMEAALDALFLDMKEDLARKFGRAGSIQ